MKTTLTALAAALGLEIKGNDTVISGVNTLEMAGPEDLSFLANPKYVKLLDSCKAGAIIVDKSHAEHVERALISPNPYLDFARAIEFFSKPQGSFSGISDKAHIDPSAEIGEGCTIYPFVYIGPRAVIGDNNVLFPGCYVGEDSSIGRNCLLYPNVTLMAGTVLGDRVILHAGVVLGSDGFGFAPGPDGLRKIPQIGVVKVGDDVEIGANTTIDRAVLEATSIGSGTKIDNLVQIGHNVEVGRHCILVSQVGISGSTKLGDRVTLAGQVGLSGHLSLGNGVTVGPKAGVSKDIPEGETWGGIPAVDRHTFLRSAATISKLPEMRKRLNKLEKEFQEISKRLQEGE